MKRQIAKQLAVLVIVLLFLQAFLVATAYAKCPSNNEKRSFIHYAIDNRGKLQQPQTPTGDYSFLGFKWRHLPVAFSVNPAGSLCDDSQVIFAFLNAANEWDDGTYSSSDNWKGIKRNLFADSVALSNKIFDGTWDSMDGANTVLFGDLNNPGIIAVTNIWYNPVLGTIIEFDMVFNTAFQWGTNGDTSLMDIQNIATHELGHSVGLGDLYDVGTDETMYGYSGYGELKKQDLYYGDQTGIKRLY